MVDIISLVLSVTVLKLVICKEIFPLVYYFQYCYQRQHFLSEVNNREAIAVIEANNNTYCLQKRLEKFPLDTTNGHRHLLSPFGKIHDWSTAILVVPSLVVLVVHIGY